MWQSQSVAGHEVDFYEPQRDRSPIALVFLHDRDGLALCHEPIATGLLESRGISCYCPLSGESWWSSRVCSAFDSKRSPERWLLDDVLPWLEERRPPSDTCLAIAGVGMGGQGALRLAFKYPERFPIVAAMNAALDHHELHGEGGPLDALYASREHCRQDTAILHVHPLRLPRHIWFAAERADRWFRGNDRLHEKLTALGVAHAFEAACRLEGLLAAVTSACREEGRRLL